MMPITFTIDIQFYMMASFRNIYEFLLPSKFLTFDFEAYTIHCPQENLRLTLNETSEAVL